MKLHFLPALICLSSVAFAQKVTVSLNSATVFLTGAELASTAKVSLPAGESEVIFTNIAGNVNAQSLSIGAGAGVVVQSATFRNNYPGDSAVSPRVKGFRDTIFTLGEQQSILADRQDVVEEQLAILKENRKVAGDNTSLSVAELQKLLDLTAAKMTSLLTDQRAILRKETAIDRQLALLQSQISQEQSSTYTPGGSLVVRFYATAATTTAINISYVVPNAGWTPSYDLRADGVGQPVHLFYKASVYQNSGIKWDNVRLSLSTGNPAEGVDAPALSPQYLTFYRPGQNNTYQWGRANAFQLNRGAANQATEEIQAFRGNVYENYRRDEDKALEERDSLGQPATMNRYTAVDASGINTTFDIELPYTIPSDAQQHTVAIKTYDLPATYRHFAVPRLDKDAFLQAQITKWEDLNLLPAATSVFFEGSYVGQGFIDMRNVRDTMNLSLGRDKKIIIRRERDRAFHSIKTIGTAERQEYAYTISVRNTRKEPVHIVVLDQVPVSNDKEIVVEDPQTEDADYNPSTGAAKWTIDLGATQLRKIRLGYVLKYPKGQTVSGTN